MNTEVLANIVVWVSIATVGYMALLGCVWFTIELLKVFKKYKYKGWRD